MKKADINMLIDRWLQVGAISQEQAEYFRADVASVVSETSGNRFISAITYIGASALSLGVLLLIASNWSGLAREVKLLLALLLPVIPLCFAYWQLLISQTPRVLGRAANILGVVLVGGSLALIGQIYNLEANMQSFFWTWALLTTPFVLVFRRTENVLFAATIIGVAVTYSLFDFLDSADVEDGVAVLLLTMVGLAYAGLLYGIGSGLRFAASWLESGRILRIGAAGLAATILFFTTFEFYARAIVGGSYRNPGNWEVLSVGLNLVFVGFLLFALLRSIKFEEYTFALSIVRLFGFYLLVKYVTLFYSMLDTGLFFVIGGIIFISGGWFLEKHKHTLVSYFKHSGYEPHSYE
jgi:uncharacterized membrane protein